MLTVAPPSNEHMVYFDQLLPKPNYIRLLSCSLYNSWYNLKRTGEIALFDDHEDAAAIIRSTPGHCNLESISKELSNMLAKYGVELSTEIYTSVGQLIINNPKSKEITLDRDLAQFLGIGHKLSFITFIKRLTYPTADCIHCDLVDPHQNLLNGKPSNLLAKFDIRGTAFKKIYYETGKHVLRDASSGEYANTVSLSVKDLNGELFDFNGMPLEFELEIN